MAIAQGDLSTPVNPARWNELVDLINSNEVVVLIALKSDGTVPLTANWDAGPYTITVTQIISDIAIGTPPIVVTSTTVVPNLNVDQVDGFDMDQALLMASSPTFVTLTLTGARISTVDTFADADATPSVSGGENFLTANTGATTITQFDDGVNGQLINIIAGDNNTTIADNANIKHNAGSDRLLGQYDVAKFIHNGTLWVGDGYSQNTV